MFKLEPQTLLSKELAIRRSFVRPPEPPSSFIVNDPLNSIYIGRTKIFNQPLNWTFENLTNPHIAIVGITGSGKSYLVKTFLTRAALVWNTNALIIDFAGEYGPWVEYSNGKVIRLGKGDCINLLDLGGMTPQSRVKQVINAFCIFFQES